MNHLPNELVHRILTFLDEKSLLEARKVCRLWNLLIVESTPIMKIFPPLIITNKTLTVDQYLMKLSFVNEQLDEKLPNLELQKIIIRNVERIETYEQKTCNVTCANGVVPVKFGKIRSVMIYFGDCLTTVTMDNLSFHGLIEICDILNCVKNLKILNFHKVSVACRHCKKNFKDTKNLRAIKISESDAIIHDFFKEIVDKSIINFTPKTYPDLPNFRNFLLAPQLMRDFIHGRDLNRELGNLI